MLQKLYLFFFYIFVVVFIGVIAIVLVLIAMKVLQNDSHNLSHQPEIVTVLDGKSLHNRFKYKIASDLYQKLNQLSTLNLTGNLVTIF